MITTSTGVLFYMHAYMNLYKNLYMSVCMYGLFGGHRI